VYDFAFNTKNNTAAETLQHKCMGRDAQSKSLFIQLSTVLFQVVLTLDHTMKTTSTSGGDIKCQYMYDEMLKKDS